MSGDTPADASVRQTVLGAGDGVLPRRPRTAWPSRDVSARRFDLRHRPSREEPVQPRADRSDRCHGSPRASTWSVHAPSRPPTRVPSTAAVLRRPSPTTQPPAAPSSTAQPVRQRRRRLRLGLEPDLRSGESQPAGALHALEAIADAGPETGQAAALLDWLNATALPDGGLPFALQLLDVTADTHPEAAGLLDHLARFVPSDGVLRVAGGAEDETLRPLDYAPEPGRPVRDLLDPEAITAALDRLAGEQLTDGGWKVAFTSYSAAALEWRGRATVHALTVLRLNSR